jgi:putative SOS response-associated peptidase YedK
MPVVLKSDTWPLWLGEEAADTSALKALLAPFPSDGMISWPVRASVGNMKNKSNRSRQLYTSEASVLNARVFANERRESV